MFHKHKWNLEDKTVLESGFEQVAKAGYNIKKAENVGRLMFTKAVVYLLGCECGAKKTLKEHS